jgi:hypothetical protein
MKTDLIIDLLAREGTHIEEGWVRDIPMGRLGHPSELQGTIVWMASDASSYLNGSDIVSGTYFPSLLTFEIRSLSTAANSVSEIRSLMAAIVAGDFKASNMFDQTTILRKRNTDRSSIKT